MPPETTLALLFIRPDLIQTVSVLLGCCGLLLIRLQYLLPPEMDLYVDVAHRRGRPDSVSRHALAPSVSAAACPSQQPCRPQPLEAHFTQTSRWSHVLISVHGYPPSPARVRRLLASVTAEADSRRLRWCSQASASALR